ncbi:hypothetical protein HON52_04485 [Candidatus Uhrbacteria bacterium]|nr:hypothetical protein [Candidatus Uhrbacteria bacterium]
MVTATSQPDFSNPFSIVGFLVQNAADREDVQQNEIDRWVAAIANIDSITRHEDPDLRYRLAQCIARCGFGHSTGRDVSGSMLLNELSSTECYMDGSEPKTAQEIRVMLYCGNLNSLAEAQEGDIRAAIFAACALKYAVREFASEHPVLAIQVYLFGHGN